MELGITPFCVLVIKNSGCIVLVTVRPPDGTGVPNSEVFHATRTDALQGKLSSDFGRDRRADHQGHSKPFAATQHWSTASDPSDQDVGDQEPDRR